MHLGGILEAKMASKTPPKSLPNRRKIDKKWTSKKLAILGEVEMPAGTD